MENKKCCDNCKDFSDCEKIYRLKGHTISNWTAWCHDLSCDSFTAKKQKREVKLYAYICYDAAVGRLIWFDSQNYVDNRHDLFKRVPSEDKVVTVEI